MRPRTKHMNIKYHHFREAVNRGDITIHPINTKDQQADIFTKPLDEKSFIYLQSLIILQHDSHVVLLLYHDLVLA